MALEPATKLPEPDTTSHLAGWRLYIVIACLFFGSFLIALDTNIINVALPKISSDFEALQDVAWYGTAYLLTITAFQPIYGSLYTYFRTDIIYRTSIFVFEVGSILCAAAASSNMFIAGRAIAGFGAAGVLQGALSIISQVVPLEKRPLYMGIVISVFVIAVTVGPVLGGVFTQNSLSIFLKIKGKESDDRALPLMRKLHSMDPLGSIVFIGATCCLMLSLHWGGQSKSWASADVIGCLVGAGLIGALFIYLQWRRGDSALIPLRIFKKRSIWTSSMVLFCLGAGTYVNVFFLPFWFQGVKSISPVSTGVDFIPLLLPQLISLIIVGAIVKRFGYYVPYMVVGELISNLPALVTSAEDLAILQDIWNTAVARTMILGTAVVGVAIPFTLGMEWLNALKVSQERKEASGVDNMEGSTANAGVALEDMGVKLDGK
ncbi:hypothetical protein INS49_015633 [Diaporthe citri]|uniref:uncharacterized protein n=1 Tax=Diaporthe citri TaxID=83186 RepID=UPI001C7FE3A0|nr:uncharacterized protein INS49_015633 [Diaporthe citri]KAG6356246.1 hypothetical protein INS49_015633 [Diaporthe citri]